MASIISAGTTSGTSLNLSADTSGQLELKTGSGPTTAITISSAQLTTIANDATISGLTVGKGGGSVTNNIVVGANSIPSGATGNFNHAFGWNTLTSLSSGIQNNAIGAGTLNANTTGSYNNALGVNTMISNTTGANNTALGHNALYSNTTASNNTAVGYQAGFAITTGEYNTAIGGLALKTNTTSPFNCAVGFSALRDNVGTHNTAIGGYQALIVNTTGNYNTAVGSGSLATNTTASNNTAVGYQALYSNTTGIQFAALGYQAGYSNTSGGSNGCYIGYKAGYSATGSCNTFVGAANQNGNGCGQLVTTGTRNTILGGYDGNQGGLDIRTASNYIVLSDGDGNPRVIHNGTTLIAAGSTTSAYSNRAFQVNSAVDGVFGTTMQYTSSGGSPQILQLYLSAQAPNNTSSVFIESSDTGALRFQVRSNGGVANYSANNVNLSDAREKTNVELAGSYLNKICAIPVKTFNYIDQNRDEDDGLTLGVIAQDVQAVAPELVMESNWAGKNEPEKMRLSIYQTDLQYALMKAIQELKAEVDSLKAQLNK